MSRAEKRQALSNECTAAGNVMIELEELRKLQEISTADGIHTISVTCSEFLTIICC